MSDAAPPPGPHDPDGVRPGAGPTDPTTVDPTTTFGAPPTSGPTGPWSQAPAAAPGPSGPYGPGWADDGTYLSPPAPAAPAPPGYGAPQGAGYGAPGPGYGGPVPQTGPQTGPPASGYGAPGPGYGAPGPQPGPPGGGFGAPGPQTGPPASGYGPPPGAYGAPAGGPGGGGGYPPVPPGGLAPLGWVGTPWGPRWRGPIGSPKSAGVTILLSIVTCGIWTYVWSYQTHEDLKRYRGDGLGGAVGLILAIVVSVAVMFTAPMEIEQMYQEEGLESPVKTMDGLWFLLPIIGNFIWYFKVQNALNDFWVARGATPA